MKTVLNLWIGGCFIAVLSGCGTTPIHAVFLSNEKNIWVEEPSGGGLSYCLSNHEGNRTEPMCYSARRGNWPEKETGTKSERMHSSSSSEAVSSQKEPVKAP